MTLFSFQIYDDNNSYGVFCGSSLPPNILVTSLKFSARFYSDESINGEGFEAFFTVKGIIYTNSEV